MSERRAFVQHKDLGLRDAGGNGRFEDDRHLAVGSVGDFPDLSCKGDRAIASDRSGVMQSEGDIQRNSLGNGLEEGAAFFQSFFPALVGNFLGFRVDVFVIVEGDLFLKDFVGLSETGDPITLTQIRDAPLEVIKGLFYFPFGLGMGFSGEF